MSNTDVKDWDFRNQTSYEKRWCANGELGLDHLSTRLSLSKKQLT